LQGKGRKEGEETKRVRNLSTTRVGGEIRVRESRVKKGYLTSKQNTVIVQGKTHRGLG